MEGPSGRDEVAVWGLAEAGRRRGVVAAANMTFVDILSDRPASAGEPWGRCGVRVVLTIDARGVDDHSLSFSILAQQNQQTAHVWF